MAATLPPQADLRRLTGLDPAGRLAALVSCAGGLSDGEAARRLATYGPNTPVRDVRTKPLLTFAANFIHTLALLLWFAAGLAFAGGAPELGGAIVAVVVVNGIFAFLQEYRAEQVVQSLMKSVAVQARVVRDGVESRVPAESLVPGDVIRVAAGDITPADAVLLADDNLTLDLSMITGESKPVERSAATASGADIVTLIDLASVLPGGAAVVTGTAEAVVCATGSESTMGRVASLVEGVERGGSILEKQVANLSLVTAIIAVIAGTGTLLLTAAFTETPFVAALTFATGVIVALVPEGLLPTLSVSLAIGARRMAARGAAVRRLSAVEVIGSVTVICTDKTGTLTQNAISVLGIVNEDGADAGTRPMEAAVLCNDARAADDGFAGDPVDVALLKFAVAQGFDVTAVRAASTRVADVPFDAQHRYMSVTCERAGRRVDYIKGAPEEVLALTKAKPTPALEKAIEQVTQRGERVLLLALAEPGAPPEILGLVRMFDPPRPEVPAAIATARRAGIRIVMLTGDHPVTASTVATTIGFAAGDMTVVEGRQLEGLADSGLLAILRRDAIFARIDPAQKLRIVTLLRRAGEVVVVTGDGINDAPALRAADVGVAMGMRGSEVAKQAADVVLADDNFATIVAAIEEGRAIKANIRRFVSYVFTSNVAELLPFLLFIFLPVPLPLAVIQVLAIDLGTDLLPALALGTEAASERVMASRPEPPHRALLTRPLFLKTFLFYGVIEAVLGMAAFFAYYLWSGWRPFEAMDESILREASTLTFLGIVSGQIGCLFASRDGPLWRRLSLRSNGWVAVGLGFEVALASALVYIPGLNGVFSMAGVSPAWLAVLPCGAAIFLILDEARRAVAGHIAK
jgi:calcium-translocating P-type ATPase